MDEQNCAKCWYHRHLYDSYEGSLESLSTTTAVGCCYRWYVAWHDLLPQSVLPALALRKTYRTLLYCSTTFSSCGRSCQRRLPKDGWAWRSCGFPVDVPDIRVVGNHPRYRSTVVAA
jgi:hypothetical protein